MILQLNGRTYCDVPAPVTDALFDAVRMLQALHALVEHARKVSPSERAVLYVADVERALGMDAPVPHKTGGNDERPQPETGE